VQAHLERARAIRQQQGCPLCPLDPAVSEELIAAVTVYLNTRLDPAQPLEQQKARLDELAGLLDQAGSRPSLAVADADGDGQGDLLLSLGFSFGGTPALVFRRQESRYVAFRLPTLGPGGEPTDILRSGLGQIERVADLNGDGRPEVVATYEVVGASAITTEVYVARWDGQGFRSLFTTTVNDWAGSGEWELVRRDGQYDLRTTCVVFGAYDHKLLPHPTLTMTYRWAGDTYVLASSQLTPPTTRRQQVNLAEAAFARGDYRQAIAEYQKVINDPNLKSDEMGTPEPDWVGYAWFRIGECYALLGEEAPARTALEKARQAGSTLGELATTFLEAYQNPDGAIKGMAAVMRSDLPQKLDTDQAGNLGFPIDALTLSAPQTAFATYFTAHPEAASLPLEALTRSLQAVGLPFQQVVAADLDGDGQREVALGLTIGRQQRLLLIVPEAGRWRGRFVSLGVSVEEVVAIPGTNKKALLVRLPAGFIQPNQDIISLDQGRVVYLVDTKSFQIRSIEQPGRDTADQCYLP
jgi:tetratricopeptide (TPR) repeat protein